MIPTHSTQSDRPFRTDSRAVSEVIGAILVFALLFLVIALIQLNAVPAANKQVEFEHDQRVTQDFQTLQDELYQVGTTGSSATVSVETGVVYPSRFFLLNPGPATGSIQTTDAQSLTIHNATAVGNVGDYWNGSSKTFTTKGITYRPDYNELANPGTLTWEHSMLHAGYDDGQHYFYDGSSFIDGRQIQLTLLDGSLSYGGLSTSVQIAPVSTRTETVTIRNAPGETLSIDIATDLTPDEFADAVDEINRSQIEARADGLRINLEDDTEYELSIAKVRVGPTATLEPGPRYITDVAGNETSVPENTTHRFTVAVRDEYNNPVSGVPVTTTPTNADLVGTVEPVDTSLTGSDGRTTFRYIAPENVDGNQDVRIRTSIGDGTDPGDRIDLLENATFHLTVIDTDRSGSPPRNTTDDGVSRINPGSDGVKLTDVSSPGGANSRAVNVTFENDAGRNMTFDEMRLLFFRTDDAGVGTALNITAPVTSGSIRVYSDYTDVPDFTISDGDELTVAFEADKTAVKGDFIGLSVLFDDGTVNNYFADVR
ncbi:Ig-like domain-containing protein [Halapricum hydrolyticum]|uniref:Ig-like domain-containing protein n=1 Tax=Halapricum hydrolyticum TaxID=2979991 RepID=A0AAE3IB39_9EURY|nr:Ig-like domain-containing protein [Halapricum hydrolyticum]MCU4718267.1 Ig-like domain-containing protein [Halapricum hydrolyticum]MCU4727285.1 Ig-like domain-containing protein [Halapricum hydrolyticum]